MKLLSLLGLSLVPLLVVSQSPPDVNLHLQDEGSVSSGEATEVMDTSSGQNNLRGSAHALSTRLQEDAALRNESSSVLASYPQQQRRQLECCGGDGGGYGELKCPEGSFVTTFYGHYDRRVHKLGIVCSNGVNVGSHGTEGQHEWEEIYSNSEGFFGLYVEAHKDVQYIEFWAGRKVGSIGVKMCPNSFWGHEQECDKSGHLDCPHGTRITGIRTRSGVWIDKIMMPFCG